MVYRLYVEKKPGFRQEADSAAEDIRSFLGIPALSALRMINRYDVDNIDEGVLLSCVNTVFSEPQVDSVYSELPADGAAHVFATEYLPGQFDQRADSAAQCVQLVSRGERPRVRTAKIYLMYGALRDEDIAAIRKYLMNPVESREAALEPFDTLDLPLDPPEPVSTVDGFIDMDERGLRELIGGYALAMDMADIKFCQAYFRDQERRDPTITEIRLLDTYWSDHCRHTTFLTTIDDIDIYEPAARAAYERFLSIRAELNRAKPMTLMELATIGARYLRYKGLLTDEDQSEEINACTVKITVDVDGTDEKWLLLFKNETHNHPTEIEPFGGAATCIGGAIRDPLSGRGYVYNAMRVTGAADPLKPIEQTMPGKLPQRKLTTTAAAGFSSYGNQIGLATGIVDEIYHDGYAAKRMEIGAVIGAAPAGNVRREKPEPGDIIILLGGRTGRDGCGGATGSSKSHDLSSLEQCGAEVQKGNAPEERKLQRLMRDPEATLLIKRCNDFGAGGVSVAIGELADGLHIDLSAVPRKYEGLNGTELAISESQERMAVVVAPDDVARFVALANDENLEATVVARVTAQPRLVMEWNGEVIVDISREFLNTNGAEKRARAVIERGATPISAARPSGFEDRMLALAGDLNICSKRGLAERFDSTIGSGAVLMPFGGVRQLTPAQAMVTKLPVLNAETKTCSAMAWGYNPYITEASPYHGAYLAVIESLAKLVATGAGIGNAHLTFQEYFERLGEAPERWGKPAAALLGALSAQLDMGIGSIGGKDSMSGSFESYDVPPTLVSFAVSVGDTDDIISPEFKRAGSKVALISPKRGEFGLPDAEDLKRVFALVDGMIKSGEIISAYAVGAGGAAEAVMKMSLGNGIGFEFSDNVDDDSIFEPDYGAIVVELNSEIEAGVELGRTVRRAAITLGGCGVDIDGEILPVYEGRLERVFPLSAGEAEGRVEVELHEAAERRAPAVKVARPRVLIPVFPGTNCEYDSARAFSRAGADPSIMVINNMSPEAVAESVFKFARMMDNSQIVFIPGGFSGGDEPDGSAKFITAFFRNPAVADAVGRLLDSRDGLVGGVCNGFQALIKLGLLPDGKISDMNGDSPTLTYNLIGRHQSRLVRTRVVSNKSPWLMRCRPGEVHLIPVSHGEGRFICGEQVFERMNGNGQIATQYVDELGAPSMDISVNPNGSDYAIEGITSPDGRVFGRMGHLERWGDNLYKNVPGKGAGDIIDGAVEYFR